MSNTKGQSRLLQARAGVKKAHDALKERDIGAEGAGEHLTVALDAALDHLGAVEDAEDEVLGESGLIVDESLVQPEPLELERIDGLRQSIQDVALSNKDSDAISDRLGDLNTLLDVSVTALGATTVDALLERVVEGARRVTGALRAAAGYGVRSEGFRFLTSSSGVDGEGIDIAAELLELTPDLLEGRHSFRKSKDSASRFEGGLIAARLVGREGAADGYLVVSGRSEGDEDFSEMDEALLGQLAAFTSLGLQHIQARYEAVTRFAEAEAERSVLRAIMEHVPEGITVADGPDATIRMVSRFGSQMFGRAPDELIGARAEEHAKLWRLYDAEGEKPASPEDLPLTRAIRNSEVITDEEWLYNGPDNSRAYALFNAGPIRDRDGTVTGGIAVWRDITKRKRAEDELLEAKERLLRQEKLAYLGALAGGVGHELRTPLGSIRNASYFLNMIVENPDEDVREALGIIEKEVKAAEGIISALLDFSRSTTPARKDVDVHRLIEQTFESIEVPDAVVVTFEMEPGVRISADPGQISQVLRNILVNAIQATNGDGRVVIRSCLRDAQTAEIRVSDTGKGIAKEHVEELFEPLFTTKARGIGLGLSVAQTLVQRHGGIIEVESKLGEGATFIVRLPVEEVTVEGSG